MLSAINQAYKLFQNKEGEIIKNEFVFSEFKAPTSSAEGSITVTAKLSSARVEGHVVFVLKLV
ncbi:hypothetical protein [Spiroplasma tabanidicola]|uniref:Uncharacterized protein n=1 Tax=Spiroplasma tabanidicola TaxID=324079 RepID=A0A6I6CHB3_9MOLU|nr:hypothetical protein [Spiroplasma tabanidicola]QGS51413.1 hypothetical protein STABA_v1c00460 [Spiroplasma tabanidicola]